MAKTLAQILAGEDMEGGEGFCDYFYNNLKNHFYGAAAPGSPTNGMIYLADDGFTYIYFDSVWYKLAGATGAAWTKTIGATGDYATWAAMIAEMPDMIAHQVTVTIERGTTLSEICDLKNKHGLTTAADIIIQAERYYPAPSAAPPTADSATATTLRDAVLAGEGFGNDYFIGCWIQIIHGTGTDNGLVLITDYVDATGDVVVANWPGVQPDATSRYIIVGALIDGGSARIQCFDVAYNSCPITFRGIGMQDSTSWMFYGQYCFSILVFACAFESPGDYGAFSRNCTRMNLTSCGVVNGASDGIYFIGGSGYIWQCGVSDNGGHGIHITNSCYATIVANFGDANANWGTYAVTSGQANIGDSECTGAAGNHSDPGTAGAAASDQAAAY